MIRRNLTLIIGVAGVSPSRCDTNVSKDFGKYSKNKR